MLRGAARTILGVGKSDEEFTANKDPSYYLAWPQSSDSGFAQFPGSDSV
jgi:hypothetical protein